MPVTTTGIHDETAGAGDAVAFLHGVTLDGRMWRMLPMEAPETFNHILERFLAGHATPAADGAGTDRLR
jgi:hypothetical protein